MLKGKHGKDHNHGHDHDYECNCGVGCGCYGGGRGNLWGWTLLLVGGYFLARDMGWIASNLPFWPVLLVALGLHSLFRKRHW